MIIKTFKIHIEQRTFRNVFSSSICCISCSQLFHVESCILTTQSERETNEGFLPGMQSFVACKDIIRFFFLVLMLLKVGGPAL